MLMGQFYEQNWRWVQHSGFVQEIAVIARFHNLEASSPVQMQVTCTGNPDGMANHFQTDGAEVTESLIFPGGILSIVRFHLQLHVDKYRCQHS